MRFEGRIKSWDTGRGYGFIEPRQGGSEVFVHISAIPRAMCPPTIGQAFTFEVELSRQGKKRAANLGVPVSRRTPPPRRAPRPPSLNVASTLAIPLFILVFLAVAVTWRVSGWVALSYIVLSIVCWGAYAADKRAARAGAQRTPEQSLLLLGLAGGWPGAIVAQQTLRHKSSKASFQSAFWGTVLLNVAAFVLIHSPLGDSFRP